MSTQSPDRWISDPGLRAAVDGAKSAVDSSRQALHAMLARAFAHAAPPRSMTIVEWAEARREMSQEETSLPGRYSMDATPALRGILMAATLPWVRKVVVQKSAQVGYTAGVVCNVVGYHIDHRPSVQVVMFPRTQSAKDFAVEKLEPMIRASPCLAALVDIKSRAPGSGILRRAYPGGLYKLVGSNSPSDVKSTSGRVGIVEEPDDVNANVGGQGNSIALLGERTKTYAPDDLQLIGGTPTAKATSLIVKEMRSTDMRFFMVPCHACGESHALEWSNVVIPGHKLTEDELALPREALDAKWPPREVFGRARWEDAFYTCPHCGAVWTDEQRIASIRAQSRVAPHYGWRATADSDAIGFYLSELLSVFEGSRLPHLARKYLIAEHEYERGEPEKLIAFWNSTLGLPWEYRGELPEEEELRARAESYAEWSTPAGGLVVLMTVDVQHDRLAVTVWAVGRGEEMWLAYWGELPGRTVVSHQGAWLELEHLMSRTVTHATGVDLQIAAVAIDSGDGQTSEAVYDFVRKHSTRQRPVFPTKGASDKVGKIEIWTKPKPIDPNKLGTKAARMGVQVHQIGTAKAKDLILGWAQAGGRVRLEGRGPGRMHWYVGVRDDWYEQLLGEMKVPRRGNPRIREWHERTDRRNEGLDCTVMAVWLCRQLRLHLHKASNWDAIEGRMRQATLLQELEIDAAVAVCDPQPAPQPALAGGQVQPAPAQPGPHAPPAAAGPAPRPAEPAPRRPVVVASGAAGISLGDGFRGGRR